MACNDEGDSVMANSPCERGEFGLRQHSRREFLTAIAALGVSTTAARGSLLTEDATQAAQDKAKTFRVWVFSDAHVGRDKKYGPRESLAEALRQSESASGYDWDIALDLGDISGEVDLPKDQEGEEIVRQFGVLKQHRREQIYDLSGNHDRSGLNHVLGRRYCCVGTFAQVHSFEHGEGMFGDLLIVRISSHGSDILRPVGVVAKVAVSRYFREILSWAGQPVDSSWLRPTVFWREPETCSQRWRKRRPKV